MRPVWESSAGVCATEQVEELTPSFADVTGRQLLGLRQHDQVCAAVPAPQQGPNRRQRLRRILLATAQEHHLQRNYDVTSRNHIRVSSVDFLPGHRDYHSVPASPILPGSTFCQLLPSSSNA